MLNIHRRKLAIATVLAVLLSVGSLLFAHMPKSYAAQHGSVTKAFSLFSDFTSADSPRAEAISHRFVYPTGDLAPDIASSAPKVYTKNATTGAVEINEPVQTFDILSPPPAFTPTETTGKLDSVNMTPSWTKDEAYIVFSSTMNDPAGKAHIWVAPATGGTPIQLTTGSGNELYPVLSPSNNFIAFVSDDGSIGTHNLYVIPFNEASPGSPVDVSTLTPLTVKQGGTSFSDIGRPAWSPSEDRIAFAGSVSSTKPFLYHIYYLYVSTDGYLPLGSAGSSNPPGQFTNGPENDTDPSWSPDGRYIAFSSNAAGFTNTGLNVNPNLGQTTCVAVSTTLDGSRSIFLITGSGTVPNTSGADLTTTGGRITNTGGLDGGPAWAVSGSPYDGFIAFHRLMPETVTPDSGGSPTNNGAQHYQIYYARIETNTASGTLTTEMTSGSTQLNTSDVVDNGTTTTANSFDDMYPTWSPQLKQLSLAYQSNRSVTYNDPTTGAPSETLINLTHANDGTVITNANYAGILVSEVENINPPTLLRFTGSEILHVNAGSSYTAPTTADPSGGAVRYVAAGTKVTFTVRLSNREAGVDPTNVYLQIKDPDSKYDDSQGLEHKEFATDNLPVSNNDTDYQDPLTQNYTNSQLYSGIVDLGVTNANNVNNPNRGAVGGIVDATHTLGVGSVAGNAQYGPVTSYSQFRSWGPEYECQALNPLYYTVNQDPNTVDPTHLNTRASDYYRPYYLAGFDDATPHSAPMIGHSGTQSPQWPNDTRTGRIKPVTWLPMTLLPASQQDANGGKLYSVTWLTPTSPSDFYLDVITYDNATNPVTGAPAKNWRIYDNIWGFTTQPWVGNNDILVVSENTLGQKFAASSLGVANLRPTMYGDESYYTGIDANLLPNALYIWSQPKGAQGYEPFLVPILEQPINNPGLFGGVSATSTNFVLNTLGPGSYTDLLIDPTFNGGVSNAPSQRYDIWRTLSRGPVDQNVLMSYAPTFVKQPAVSDNGITNAAATFPVAKKCVIWASPFTGDLLVGPGTFGSPSTQAQIAQFINAGGRLFVSGQDVGSTITINGTINNSSPTQDFLPEYLGSTWKGLTTHNPVVTPGSGVANRISHDAIFNQGSPFSLDYWTLTSAGVWVYGPPSSYPNIVSNAFDLDAFSTSERSDGSMVDLTTDGVILVLGHSQSNTGNAVNGTMDELNAATVPGETVHNDYTVGGGSDGLVYYENTKNFGRVAYASFDFGGFGEEYYKVTVGQADYYPTHDFRAMVMHNIVTYLRTGAIAGTIRQNSGTGGGQVVPGATVYAIPNGGSAPGMPAGRTVYSATTDASGNYRMDGIESGSYTVVAYKAGFARATSLYAVLVEGDNSTTVSLNMTAVPPGSISGTVTSAADKSPVANATVTFTAAGTSPLSAVTDSNGNYSIQNVPAGTYTGSASKGTAVSTSQTTTVISGQDDVVNFSLPEAPGQVTGTVSDTNGPINGATVSAVLQTGGTPITATTNASGQYTLANVPPGTYSITASASGHFPSTQKLSVSTGDLATLNFTLQIGTPTILWGLVEGSAAKTPLGGVTVNVKDNNGNVVATFVSTSTTTSAADGSGGTENYQVGLPAGTYTLEPSVAGNNPITVTVSGAFAQQNIDIATGVIGGVITAGPNGGPVTGATVTVKDSSGNTVGTTTTTAMAPPPAGISGEPAEANYYIDIVPNTSATPYTVTVTDQGLISPAPAANVVVTANTWTSVNLSFKVVQSYSAGLHFISVPYDYTSVGWDTLFGPKNGPTANRSPAFIWQQQLQNGIGAYVSDPTPPADTVHYGLGYWIKLTSGVDITTQGFAIGTPTVSVPLSAGWNMVGVPNPNGIQLSAITFANPADPTHPITYDQATSQLYHLIDSTFYGYNETAHDYSDTVSANSTTPQLAPWKGYWLYAYQACTIQLPTGS